MAVVLLGGFAFALLQSLINPVLPRLREELGTTQTHITWVVTAFRRAWRPGSAPTSAPSAAPWERRSWEGSPAPAPATAAARRGRVHLRLRRARRRRGGAALAAWLVPRRGAAEPAAAKGPIAARS
ncbi:hypothetical protein OH779_37210 [Actinacidiphila glaucinigra]|uniref:hypothetical protein n=1 Tax=Actinacidiphila glaucinigra TaxID=235986 RepID=UPI00386E873D